MKKAEFFQTREDGKVQCNLCPNACIIAPGSRGVCRVRENRDGVLYSLNYGKVTSLGLDPVEKKPLFHFNPGGLLLSIGTFGCNFSCEFCQNWQISQAQPEYTALEPDEIVRICLNQRKRYPETVGIAYTYNEPAVFFEFVRDCAEKAKQEGLANVLVTNGFWSRQALKEILPLVDALNIDVKAYKEDFYKRVVHGRLEPVLNAVEEAQKVAWVEVTYLVIPGENDDPRDVKALSAWLSKLNPSIPMHLSRYFPAYRMKNPPTPEKTLENLREAALENLNYVYIGNAWKKGYADTLCPDCKEVLLERGLLELEASHVKDGKCPRCGRPLDIKGSIWV